MGSWLRRTSLVAAAAVVLAGCTTGDGSTNVLGDLATVQPCSLTSLDVFAEFGTAEFGPPEALGYCTVLIKPAATDSFARAAAEEITIMIGALSRPSADPYLPTDKLEDVGDSLYTTKPDDAEVSCWQTLIFAGEDLALSVRSRMRPTAGPVPTCDMVTAGMAKVVEVIRAGEVEHRKPAANSLIALDPCDLITDETITALPGFAKARRVSRPDHHECYWQTSPSIDTLHLRVAFWVGPPPKPSTTFDSSTVTIAGRPSVTSFTGETCTIETAHIPFGEQAGYVETVTLTADAPCEGALTVARALWPRLPNP